MSAGWFFLFLCYIVMACVMSCLIKWRLIDWLIELALRDTCHLFVLFLNKLDVFITSVLYWKCHFKSCSHFFYCHWISLVCNSLLPSLQSLDSYTELHKNFRTYLLKLHLTVVFLLRCVPLLLYNFYVSLCTVNAPDHDDDDDDDDDVEYKLSSDVFFWWGIVCPCYSMLMLLIAAMVRTDIQETK